MGTCPRHLLVPCWCLVCPPSGVAVWQCGGRKLPPTWPRCVVCAPVHHDLWACAAEAVRAGRMRADWPYSLWARPSNADTICFTTWSGVVGWWGGQGLPWAGTVRCHH